MWTPHSGPTPNSTSCSPFLITFHTASHNSIRRAEEQFAPLFESSLLQTQKPVIIKQWFYLFAFYAFTCVNPNNCVKLGFYSISLFTDSLQTTRASDQVSLQILNLASFSSLLLTFEERRQMKPFCLPKRFVPVYSFLWSIPSIPYILSLGGIQQLPLLSGTACWMLSFLLDAFPGGRCAMAMPEVAGMSYSWGCF